jgi:HEAT repeat protein
MPCGFARLMNRRDAIRCLVSWLRSRKKMASKTRLDRESLNHPSSLVRRPELESLTAAHPPDVQRVLTAALSDRSWEVRVAALEGLAVAVPDGQRCPPEMLRLDRDPNKLVRLEFVEAAGIIGDRSALPRVKRLLGDRSLLLGRYAAKPSEGSKTRPIGACSSDG